MTLTVLNVACPFAPVGPDAVGGAGQILSLLDAALVESGHRSLVLACAGSQVAGELESMPPIAEPTLTDARRRRLQQLYRARIEQLVHEFEIDLVHYHGLDFPAYRPELPVPQLATLHLPPAWYAPRTYEPDFVTCLVCVSRSQRRACLSGPCTAYVIENGVPVDVLRPAPFKRNYAVALGRICPEKGFHLALDAAQAAGLPLLLAGEVFPHAEHQTYFEHEIRPRLSADRRYLGPVGLKRKRRLLAQAACLIVPGLMHEAGSLVALEALACGTPVVGLARGALPEIIAHGRTGYLTESPRGLAPLLQRAARLNPRACRRAAETRFDARRMCCAYLELYDTLAHRTAQPSATTAEGRT